VESREEMARDNRNEAPGKEMSDVVSVIGPGMEIVGDIKCDGTVRLEGRVEGSVKASKSVVVGREGSVTGDIETQDVVVAGRVSGTVIGASRVELQDTCHVEGDIRSRRIKLDEGGRVEGSLHMGTDAQPNKKAPDADRPVDPAKAAGPPKPLHRSPTG